MVTNAERHRAWLCSLLAAAATLWLPPEARAEGNIGVASVVRNDVTGVLVSGTVKVNIGANVFSNEIMKTAKDSSAKLVFTDSTNLAIGPNSTVKLNHFVFSGPSSYGKATIEVAKGAFRFTTGHSDKRAYEINTGVATIGVRGTIFEGDVSSLLTRIHVVEGNVSAQTKNGQSCEVQAGQSVSLTDTTCTPIPSFDLSFSSELTEIQEFSQVQAGKQSPFSAKTTAQNGFASAKNTTRQSFSSAKNTTQQSFSSAENTAQQSFSSAENTAIYVVTGAAAAGGVAAAVTVSTEQSHPDNFVQELLLWAASHPLRPISN